jgi:hypothetical protein
MVHEANLKHTTRRSRAAADPAYTWVALDSSKAHECATQHSRHLPSPGVAQLEHGAGQLRGVSRGPGPCQRDDAQTDHEPEHMPQLTSCTLTSLSTNPPHPPPPTRAVHMLSSGYHNVLHQERQQAGPGCLDNAGYTATMLLLRLSKAGQPPMRCIAR